MGGLDDIDSKFPKGIVATNTVFSGTVDVAYSSVHRKYGGSR